MLESNMLEEGFLILSNTKSYKLFKLTKRKIIFCLTKQSLLNVEENK